MTNTEPVAWIGLGIPEVDAPDWLSFSKPPGRSVALYPESALQAERERAEKAIKHYLHELETSQIECERAEKAEAERDKLRAELAALKEALRNPSDDMVSSGLITARETGEITEVFKAMTAHLLKD